MSTAIVITSRSSLLKVHRHRVDLRVSELNEVKFTFVPAFCPPVRRFTFGIWVRTARSENTTASRGSCERCDASSHSLYTHSKPTDPYIGPTLPIELLRQAIAQLDPKVNRRTLNETRAIVSCMGVLRAIRCRDGGRSGCCGSSGGSWCTARTRCRRTAWSCRRCWRAGRLGLDIEHAREILHLLLITRAQI